MLESIRRSAESWGVKILFGLIILVFVFWGVGSYDSNETQVVAMVNERPILAQEFARNVERTINEMRRRSPGMSADDLEALGLKQQVLSQMITDELLREQAVNLNITASPAEVADQIRAIPTFLDDSGAFNKERYRMALAQQDMTPAMFEQDVRNAVAAMKLKRYVTLPAAMDEEEARDIYAFSGEQRTLDYILVGAEQFSKDIEPTQEQLEAYYQENREKFKLPERVAMAYVDFTPESLAGQSEVSDAEVDAYYQVNKDTYVDEEQVKARHILIQVPDTGGEEADKAAKARIEALTKQVEEGADFGELAKEHSQDPSATNGGDLGWVPKGIMVESFEDALFSTPAGEMSAPVRTPFGWHVILVEERRDERQKALSEVMDEVRETVARNKAADTLTDKLDQGLEMIISGVSLERIASELNLEMKKTELLSRSEYAAQMGMDELSQSRLFGLEQGEPTDMPIASDKGYMLAEVIEKKPAEYQPLEDVRKEVMEGVSMQIGLEKAKAEAEILLGKVQKDGLAAEDKESLQSTPPFGRRGFIQGLGSNEELAGAAFAAEKGDWLDSIFAMGDGYIVARIADIAPPEEELWDQNKMDWIQALYQGRQDELFQAFISTLRADATVEIKNESLLK